MLGAFHGSDIPEFFGSGVNPDFIGTDALGMFFSGICMYYWTYPRRYYHWHSVNFANTGNPTVPHNPKSLLSTVDWQPWSSSADHPQLTFLDPVPDVRITFDNFRVSEINLLNNLFLHFATGSLDTVLMDEALTVNPDDKADAGYILRSDEEL